MATKSTGGVMGRWKMNLTASRLAARSPIKRKRAVAPKKAKELDLSTYSNRIAARLLELRNQRGWSREQLWQALDENGVRVSVHTIEAWETGARDVGTDHLPGIAKAFGKSIRAFLPAE